MASSSADRLRWLELRPLIDSPEPPPLELLACAEAPFRSRVGARCHKDGRPIAQHPRCSACGALAGPEHVVATLYRGRCPFCL